MKVLHIKKSIVNVGETLKVGAILVLGFFFVGCKEPLLNMVQIPDQDYSISQTEITQEQFKRVMRYNGSFFEGKKRPAENVSWFDAIYFCNRLSKIEGLEPVYSVGGQTDPKKWGYVPGQGDSIKIEVVMDRNASGYRLPLKSEWIFAAKGGEDYRYPGSATLSEVAWYASNSEGESHEVGLKKPNGYGLYDMSGNVLEWVWEATNIDNQRVFMGGCWKYSSMYTAVNFDLISFYANYQCGWVGFRVAKTESSK